MKLFRYGKLRIIGILAILAFLTFLLSSITGSTPGKAYAQDIPTDTPGSEAAPADNTNLEVVNPYFSIEHETLADGTQAGRYIINGPPEPPADFLVEREASIKATTNATTLANFPSFSWVYGCSSVSGAMIAAYYDSHGYPNMYTGPTNGGVMPQTDTAWLPEWEDVSLAKYPNNPLIASHNGVDGRATKGSIDDSWVQYLSGANDPYITNGWEHHTWGTAIGDYMKTSQSIYGNVDGSTSFYYLPNNTKLTCSYMASYGWDDVDGTYGRKLFYEARGYGVTDCYSQNTDNNYPGGFSLADFQAEIDAGNPVLLNLAGHSIVGYGYEGSTIYIRDTWSSDPNYTPTMQWGGIYADMELLSVSVVHLSLDNPIPTITNINPASTTVGGGAFALTVNGTNFVNTSTVRWNGTDRTTNYISSTQLQASITAADIASVGTATVTVFTPTPGGGTSNGVTFTINNPVQAKTIFLPALVLRLNQNPSEILLSNNSITENQPINSIVGSLSTIDPDIGNTFTYNLISGAGDTGNIFFNILGNQLRSSAVFDYETKNSYSIRIRSTDQGGLYFEKVFIITIISLNPIINGNFEQGRVGWTEYSYYGYILIYEKSDLPHPPYDGNWAAWLGGWVNNETSAIEQQVTVPPASPYLSYWLWIDSIDFCEYDVGGVLISGTVEDAYWLCSDNNTSGWIKRVINLSAYAGQSVLLEFLAGNDETFGSSMFIDHVAFQGSSSGADTEYEKINHLGASSVLQDLIKTISPEAGGNKIFEKTWEEPVQR